MLPKAGEQILKLKADLTLFRSEKCIIEVFKDALALQILLNNEVIGYAFNGNGRLVLDAILETPKGAVGNSIEKKLEKTFIALCPKEKLRDIKQNLLDLSDLELTEKENFKGEVEKICEYLFRMSSHFSPLDINKGYLLILSADPYGVDIIVSKERKFAYTSKEQVFMLKNGKGLIYSPSQVLIVKNGRITLL